MDVTRFAGSELLLIHLEQGADLRVALETRLAAAGVEHAWIVGRGVLDEVELREGSGTRSFATPSRLVALDGLASQIDGRLAVGLSATVSRHTPRGLDFAGGEVVAAVAQSVDLLVTVLAGAEAARGEADDASAAAEAPTRSVASERVDRAARSRAVASADERRNERSAPGPRAAANDPWAALAAASEEADAPPPVVTLPTRGARAPALGASAGASAAASVIRRPTAVTSAPMPAPATPVAPRKKTSFDDVFPEAGDLVDHFAFGRCEVLKSDGDELVVRDEGGGRTRTIRLGVLVQQGPFDDGGRRLFRFTQRRGPA